MMDAFEVDCPKCTAKPDDNCLEDGRIYVWRSLETRISKEGEYRRMCRYSPGSHIERHQLAKSKSSQDDCCFCGQGWAEHVQEACYLIGDMALPTTAVQCKNGFGWEEPYDETREALIAMYEQFKTRARCCGAHHKERQEAIDKAAKVLEGVPHL